MHTLDRNSAHTVRQNVIAPAALLRSASGHPAHAQASSPGVSEIPVLPGICADEDKKLRETGAFCRMRERGVCRQRGLTKPQKSRQKLQLWARCSKLEAGSDHSRRRARWSREVTAPSFAVFKGRGFRRLPN